MKVEEQSLVEWLKALNPKHQVRILEMIVGTGGGVATALFLHLYVIPAEAPIDGLIWIACGLVGLYYGYRNWRDSW